MVDLESWKTRLSKFMRQKDRELVSRAKKDLSDFFQITDLVKELGLYGCVRFQCAYFFVKFPSCILRIISNAVHFGLYSQMYEKVMVISKEPLPNYRPDLDDKRPQREV